MGCGREPAPFNRDPTGSADAGAGSAAASRALPVGSRLNDADAKGLR